MDSPLKPSKLPSQDNGRGIHDWAQLAISEGESFLQSQDGFSQTHDIIKSVMGTTYEDKLRPNSISQLNLNYMGKVGLDLASSLTDIKPFFQFATTNVRFQDQAEMGQKLATAWWSNRLIDMKFCDVIKYALAAGSGYAHPTYDSDIQDLNLLAEDPRDVLPIRPSDMISVQNCFGVAIRRERTVNYLRHMYPRFANRIHADREGSYAAMARKSSYVKTVQNLGLVSGFMSNLYASLGGRSSAAPLNVPVADLFTIYVKDDSVNETGRDQIMGDADSNWSYVVKQGEPLYPRKRCIVMCRSCPEPLYDGPNIYWHGQFPISKLTLDPWPWSWLGKSPLKDLLTIQREIDKVARGISDKFEKYWRPDMVTDSKTMSKAAMDRIDTRRAGLRFRANALGAQKPIEMIEPNLQSVGIAVEWLKGLTDAMKELSGTQELTNLVQLGQIPSSETIERMTESSSLAVRIRSRVMEAFLREIAMMTLMNFFQFYTTAQRISILGPSGLTFEDFDFDPGTLIPDMLNMGLADEMGNPLPRQERALKFIQFFTYQIAPGSLLAASEVTDKLMYLQLSRMGFVDPVTLLEKLKVNNIAPPDMMESMGKTIMERLQWAQRVGLTMAVGPAGAQAPASGRKATAQQSPRMVVKES